jgi:Tol biopolymer transport system component
MLFSACSINVAEPVEEGANLGPDVEESTTTPASTQPASEVDEQSVDSETSGNLNLEGLLYYIGFIEQQQNLLRLDLSTGEQSIVFDPPENAWLNDASVSPDGSQIVLSYAPPPEEGQVQFGFTDLYVMPADGSSEPTPLLERTEASETFFNVTWPMNNFIYYAHFAPSTDDLGAVLYSSQVERIHLPDRTAEVLAQEAAWPRVSRDGTLLAYVTETNDFLVSAADGSNPKPILDPEAFTAVDAPLFSPDNNQIYFSAVEPTALAPRLFLDRLLGVEVATAHSVPSDWWITSIDGSAEPEQLTTLNAIGLYGDFNATGTTIAFIAADGVYVMRPDGSELEQIREIPTAGSLDWVP